MAYFSQNLNGCDTDVFSYADVFGSFNEHEYDDFDTVMANDS